MHFWLKLAFSVWIMASLIGVLIFTVAERELWREDRSDFYFGCAEIVVQTTVLVWIVFLIGLAVSLMNP